MQIIKHLEVRGLAKYAEVTGQRRLNPVRETSPPLLSSGECHPEATRATE